MKREILPNGVEVVTYSSSPLWPPFAILGLVGCLLWYLYR